MSSNELIIDLDQVISDALEFTASIATSIASSMRQMDSQMQIKFIRNTPRPCQTEPVIIDLCDDSPVKSQSSLVKINEQNNHGDVISNQAASSVQTSSVGPSSSATVQQQSTTTSKESDLSCPICFEACKNRQPHVTKCGHIFCKECIVQTIRVMRKCPICKKDLTAKKLIRIYL